MLEELAEATRIVSAQQDGQALIDVQLDVWYARQCQLDNAENCANLEGG
jgi:hypothetical protein